jgi:hypothetical protein
MDMPIPQPEEPFDDRIIEALRTAEVISVFFVRVGRSMILDSRAELGVQPAIILDDIVSTPQARLQSFRRLRPGLPLPDRLTLAPWTSAVRDFRDRGMLAVLLERCAREGGADLRAVAERSYQELVILERKYLRDLVRGVGMQTIWERSDP